MPAFRVFPQSTQTGKSQLRWGRLTEPRPSGSDAARAYGASMDGLAASRSVAAPVDPSAFPPLADARGSVRTPAPPLAGLRAEDCRLPTADFFCYTHPQGAPVAQLDRALVSGTKGRAFESRRAYQSFQRLTRTVHSALHPIVAEKWPLSYLPSMTARMARRAERGANRA